MDVAVTPPEGYINLRRLSDEGHKKVVYTAFHILTRSWKILKEFRESPSEQTLREDLRPLIGQLSHENLVKQELPQEVGKNVWLIEEQLDGTFQELAPLEDPYAYAILALHISNALEYLHNRPDPIVHGDIHLKNCGVLAGIGKLLDFGQATYDDPLNPHSAPRGYICTRAPEQFDKAVPVASTQMDIWAFGCTLYALRTGEYPFITPKELDTFREAGDAGDTESAEEIEHLVLVRANNGFGEETSRRYFELFDEELRAILDAMLQPTPDARVPATELVQSLQEYADRSEESLQPIRVEPEELYQQARAMLTAHRVADLAWFKRAVEEGPSALQ